MSKEDSQLYVFVSGKEGEVEQWKMAYAGEGLLTGNAVRTFKLPSIVEGMVVDDELGFLYVAEEREAIWRIYAHPDSSDDRFLVSGLEGGANLVPDLEGLALYTASNQEGFLIASSQGNSSFALFKRKAPYPYLGSFHIGPGNGIDGTSSTDGIAVLNAAMGPNFPKGLFVAQDDRNDSPDGKLQRQNFKFVPWERIMDSLGVLALVDTTNFVR